MDIVARAKNIILTPKTEWPVIAAEATSVEAIYRNYLVYIAAIPAIAGFIGFSLIGIAGYHIGIVSGLLWAICSYVVSLIVVYLVALVADKLAPTFNSTPNFLNAFKLAGYSMTAAWLAGIFSIIPILGILGILGLYSIYLLYTGLPVLMKTPNDKSLIYTIAVIVAGLIIQFIIGSILSRLFLYP